jgi:signal transduction histidine kinase
MGTVWSLWTASSSISSKSRGLLPALLASFERYTVETGVLVNFKHQGVEGRFASEVETCAYRVVQEALANVARHAGVDTVTVRVWANADMLNLHIAVAASIRRAH